MSLPKKGEMLRSPFTSNYDKYNCSQLPSCEDTEHILVFAVTNIWPCIPLQAPFSLVEKRCIVTNATSSAKGRHIREGGGKG